MKQLTLISLLLLSLTARAQLTNLSEVWKDHEYKGDELFIEGLYEAAIDSYMLELEDGKINNQAVSKIALSYKKLGNYKDAAYYFNILGKSFDLDTIYYKDYADVLMVTGEYQFALNYYETVLKLFPGDAIIMNKIAGIKKREDYLRDEQYVKIEQVPFNSAGSDYALRPFEDGLAFTSSQIVDGIIQHNYLRNESKLTTIYTVKYEGKKVNNPQKLLLDKYRSKNDGPLSQFKSTVAISRTNLEKGEYRKTLGIYFYHVDSLGSLEFKYQYPYNNIDYSLTHPVFSSRGDTLFFASNMPGGYGGFDIYYSVIRSSIWSAPINLGPQLNTAGNEVYPYSNNGTLYFSSDGHPGLGGIDVYKLGYSKRDMEIINLGAPINTTWDDFGIMADGTHGFVSSNRPNGKGLDDIYEYYLLPKPKVIEPVEVKLSLMDKRNDVAVVNAMVTLINGLDTITVSSDENGIITEVLMPGEYKVDVRREPYIDFSFNISLEEGSHMKQVVMLEPAIAIHIVSPDSIMFKFGKYDLLHEEADEELDAIIKTMNDYPDLNLVISAHTDSRGKFEYNQWLSERRAETAANYIIKAGIAPERIGQHGYGETRLLNNCRDGIRCSDELHAVNRRLEFDFVRPEEEK